MIHFYVSAFLHLSYPISPTITAARGIVLTGGGALLTGLEQLLEERLGITTMTAEEPTTCVAVGTGKYMEVMNSIRD